MQDPIKSIYWQKAIRLLVIVAFILTSFNIPLAQAQDFRLPKPGVRVSLSPPVNPAILKGIKVHTDNPFQFEFIMDVGDQGDVGAQHAVPQHDEANRLIKYFLASLTVPERDLWVNLSPYEKDRIVPESFGLTEMGRDLLAEDYILKQITASLIYPEDEVGKKFWKRIYEEAAKKYNTTNIPVNTFNKVWIVPEKAVVYENAEAGTAYVVESRLKVMLEADYLSEAKNGVRAGSPSPNKGEETSPVRSKDVNQIGSQIIREIVIPELTREVNEGQNFVQLRQVYNSLILATWYKKKIKDSILAKVYADQNKVAGVDYKNSVVLNEVKDLKRDSSASPQNDTEMIYQRYIQAFKKGVYNYIKEEPDPVTQQPVPRKYFSGGLDMAITTSHYDLQAAFQITQDPAGFSATSLAENSVVVQARIDRSNSIQSSDKAMNVKDDKKSSTRQISAEQAQEYLKSVVSDGGRRSLLWTEDVDSIDQQLRTLAQSQSRQYLRLTLHEEGDLARGLTKIYVKDGRFIRQPGALAQIIQNGGVLLIDYAHSDPKQVEALNSLFDKNPYLNSLKASGNLIIVGAINDSQANNFPGSFYSRYQSNSTTINLSYEDPMTKIQEYGGEVFEGIVTDLWEIDSLRKLKNRLIGTYEVDENGNIKVIEGALIKALRENKPILIQGAAWKSENFIFLMRQILNSRQIEFNGEVFDLPEDFVQRVKRKDRKYSKDIVNKKLMAPGEPTSSEEVWIINQETQEILFGIKAIGSDGKILGKPGLLSRDKLRLRITGSLDISIWHQIMHSSAAVDIEVAPGIVVPSVYQSLRSEKLKQFASKTKFKNLQEVKDQKSFVAYAQDLEFAYTRILQALNLSDDQVLRYPVSSETRIKDLVEEQLEDSISLEQLESRAFKIQEKEILTALRKGQTVVLEGVQNNESIFQKFESALGEEGYLSVNGQRILLKDLPGRLIILTKPLSVLVSGSLSDITQIPTNDQQLGEILAKEFQGRFNPEEFKKVLELRDSFKARIPASDVANLYPTQINFDLPRMRLLLEYRESKNDWLKAFENVIIPAYTYDPNVAAYMRTMVRLKFGIDYAGQHPQTIHSKKLQQLLASMKPEGTWQKSWTQKFWMLTDVLSLDLLQKVELKEDFTATNKNVYDLIQKALIKKASLAPKDMWNGMIDLSRQRFYRTQFGIQGDVTNAPLLDESLNIPDFTWQEQKERVLVALSKNRGVMLKGSPGTGKSFITEQIARELNFSGRQIIGPITVGSDTHESDITVQMKNANGKSTPFYQEVAQWTGDAPGYEDNKKGALLIIDEANLPKETDFWEFLRRMGSKNHKIIFTGNQETLVNRQRMATVENYFITVDFKPFEREFFKDRVKEYVRSDVKNREQLINMIVDLHFFFQQMNLQLDLSLRDIQELAARVNVLLQPDWNKEDVIALAWNVYRGNFSQEEQEAFGYLIREKFGVLVGELDRVRYENIRQKRGASYKAKGFVLVDPSAEYVADVQDFLTMRQARIDKKSSIQGKRGMINEGPSALGKDEIVLEELQFAGFSETSLDLTKKFYRITASTDNVDEVIKIIEQSKKEGSIVVISEMNLFPSGFLEGRLNDVLTGNAHAGFVLIATMNSTDFHGRERLSSALQNRVIYKRLRNYNSEELTQIARGYIYQDSFSKDKLKLVVNAHIWLRSQIENPEHHPTLRDFKRMLQNLKDNPGEDVAGLASKVYQLYLDKFSKIQQLPTSDDLLKYEEDAQKVKQRKFQMMRKMAWHLMGGLYSDVDIWEDSADKNQEGGHWEEARHVISLRSRGLESGSWEGVLLHEASHAVTTRSHGGSVLWQDLEDLRHETAHRYLFPHSVLGLPGEGLKDFLRMTVTIDTNMLDQWMSRSVKPLNQRMMFQYTLWVYANTILTPENQKQERQVQLGRFADFLDSFYAQNPVRLALKHLEAARAFGESFAKEEMVNHEQERQYQQFRADALWKTMEADFNRIPFEEQETKDLTEDEIEKEQQRSAKAARNLNGPELVEEEQAPKVESFSGDLEAKQKAFAQKLASKKQTAERRVNKILDEIALDLNVVDSLLDDRLLEIIDLLENPSYSGNVVDLINQIRKLDPNSEVIKKVDQVLVVVKDLLKNRNVYRQDIPETIKRESWWDDLKRRFRMWVREYWPSNKKRMDTTGEGRSQDEGGQSLGRGGRALGGKKKIGRRHGADVHGQKAMEKSDPRPVMPKEVKKEKIALTGGVSKDRLARMKYVSSKIQGELMQALDTFIQIKTSPDIQRGLEGELDLEGFVQDPSRGYVKNAGVAQRVLKNIVLIGGQASWNSILEETFEFLFEQGFKVTVYTSDTSYIEEISSLVDLKNVLGRASQTNQENVLRDLRARLLKDSYELVNMEDIQRKVEGLYAYQLARSIVLDEKIEGEQPDNEGSQETLPKVGMEAYIEELKNYLGQEYPFLKNNINFEMLESGGVEVLPNREVEWPQESIPFVLAACEKYLGLKFRSGQGKWIYDPLTFEEQVEATRKLLKDLGLEGEERISARLLINPTTNKIVKLSLHGLIDPKNLIRIRGLTSLQELKLTNINLDDAGLQQLTGLSNLALLDVDGTQVTNDGILKLIGSHPNGKELVVRFEGFGTRWENVPEKYRRHLAVSAQEKGQGVREYFDVVKANLMTLYSIDPTSYEMKVEEKDGKQNVWFITTESVETRVQNEIAAILGLKPSPGNVRYSVQEGKTSYLFEEYSFDEQIQEAKELVKELGFNEQRVTVGDDRNLSIDIENLGQNKTLFIDMGIRMKRLKRLGKLNIRNVELRSDYLSVLKGFQKLVKLDFFNTKLNLKSLKFLNSLVNLKELNLIATGISDEEIMEFIRNHPNSKNLMVFAGDGQTVARTITWKGVKNDSELSLEEQIEVAKDLLRDLGVTKDDEVVRRIIVRDVEGGQVIELKLSGIKDKDIDRKLSKISGLRNVAGLDLNQTAVSDEGLKFIKGLSGLRAVDLTGTNVTDEALKNLGSLVNLRWVRLSNTDVTDAGLKYLKGLEFLFELSFSATSVSDDAIKRFMGAHPLGNKISVYNSKLRLIDWSEVPDEYKKKVSQEKSKQVKDEILDEKKLTGKQQLLKLVLDHLIEPEKVLKDMADRFMADGLEAKAKVFLSEVGSKQARIIENSFVVDAAMDVNKFSKNDVGGIDLNSDRMNLEVTNGGEIKFNIDPAMLQKFQNVPGFVPVIINITPLSLGMGDLREFLGIKKHRSPLPR